MMESLDEGSPNKVGCVCKYYLFASITFLQIILLLFCKYENAVGWHFFDYCAGERKGGNTGAMAVEEREALANFQRLESSC